MTPIAEKIAGDIAAALREGDAAAQDALLAAAGARATGLWRLEGAFLVLAGFRAVPEMDPEVVRAFQAATARVPLDRRELGIVEAAVAGAPAAARAGPPGGHDGAGRGGSPGWLVRFGAAQSLAVPVLRGGRVSAVIAISRAEPFPRGSPPWTLLEDVAAALEAIGTS